MWGWANFLPWWINSGMPGDQDTTWTWLHIWTAPRPKIFTSKLLVGASLQLSHVGSYCEAPHEGFFLCVCQEAFQGSLFYLNKDKELVQCQRCPTGVKRQLCSNASGVRPEDVQLQRGPRRRQPVPANQQRGCLSKGTVLCVNDDRFILQSASQIMALFHLLSYMLSKHHKPFCAMGFWKS